MALEDTAAPDELLGLSVDIVRAGHDVEGLALQLALRRADGLEARAARIAAMPTNTLRRLIRPGGRQAALGPLAAELRGRIGYVRGNPDMIKRKDDDDP